MRSINAFLVTLTTTLFASTLCFGQGTPIYNSIPKELQPKLVTIEKNGISLSDALAELQKQAGVHVADRQQIDSDPKIILNIHRSTFWKSLDIIARAANVQIALFEDDGVIAIVNHGIRARYLHYAGLFRIAAKRVALQRNLFRGGSSCSLALDVAWEPRFEPLYMEVGPSTIVYAPDKNGKKAKHEMPGRGTLPVSQRSAMEFGLAFPNPNRSVPQIASLHGNLVFTGPVKMLSFEFKRLTPIAKAVDVRKLIKDGHEVRLSRVATRPGRWSFDLHIVKPAGDVEFESFQSWMGNNRIMLVKDDGVKKTVLTPKVEYEELLEPETDTGAAIRYVFVEENGQRLGKLADWHLVYRTPGRIVRFAVPYSFQNVPLP